MASVASRLFEAQLSFSDHIAQLLDRIADRAHQRGPFFRSTFCARRMLFDRDLAIAQIPFRTEVVAPMVRLAAYDHYRK